MTTEQSIVGAQTLVAVATYNEIENVPRLVDGIFRALPHAHLLIVDDNSPDGTGQWCAERAQRDTRIHVLHRPGKLGLGTATLAGLEAAIASDYAFVVTMDADLSHDPAYLPELVAAMDPVGGLPFDVMIGSRYVSGGGVRGWPWHRRWMSRGVNLYARAMLGLTVRDCSGAFRCYRTATLRKLDLQSVRSQGYAVFEELLWHLHQCGARCGELPIVFIDRDRGKSKIDLQEAISAMRIISQIGWSQWTTPPLKGTPDGTQIDRRDT